jgi:hypothetical protein
MVACSGAGVHGGAVSSRLSAVSQTVSVNPTLRRMAEVRELRALRDVSEVEATRAEMLERLKAHIRRAVPRSEIDGEQAFLEALGVLPPGADYEASVYDALRESLAGMYEPFDKTMYVPSDLTADILAMSRAHEAVHALQDQHFDLAKREQWVPGAGDTMLARSCLAEGDATSASDAHPPIVDVDALDYIERELAAPYVFGTAFVRALRQRGGWDEVNRAWAHDLTSEQILHPAKWFSGETAAVVPPPTIASLGPGAERVWSDVRGELGIRLALGSAVGAEGWDGDTVVVAHAGKTTAVAWRIRYDDVAQAERGRSALAQLLGTRACHLSRRERDVLVLAGPPRDVCTRWSQEIF